VSASLAEDKGSWRLRLPWFEAGAHSVAVSMDGAALGSGPLSLEAEPRTVCLAACTFEGPGLRECVAGEPFEFSVRARDVHGHDVTAVDASFVVDVSSGADEHTKGGHMPLNLRCPRMGTALQLQSAVQVLCSHLQSISKPVVPGLSNARHEQVSLPAWPPAFTWYTAPSKDRQQTSKGSC
jgi:hypothetical protein